MLQPPPTRRQHDTHTQLARGVVHTSALIDLGSNSECGEAGLGSTRRALRLLLFCLFRHEVNKRVVLGVG